MDLRHNKTAKILLGWLVRLPIAWLILKWVASEMVTESLEVGRNFWSGSVTTSFAADMDVRFQTCS